MQEKVQPVYYTERAGGLVFPWKGGPFTIAFLNLIQGNLITQTRGYFTEVSGNTRIEIHTLVFMKGHKGCTQWNCVDGWISPSAQKPVPPKPPMPTQQQPTQPVPTAPASATPAPASSGLSVDGFEKDPEPFVMPGVPEFHQWLGNLAEELKENEWVQENAFVEPPPEQKPSAFGVIADDLDEWGFPVSANMLLRATEDFKDYVVYTSVGTYVCDCRVCGQEVEVDPDCAPFFEYDKMAYCNRDPFCCP